MEKPIGYFAVDHEGNPVTNRRFARTIFMSAKRALQESRGGKNYHGEGYRNPPGRVFAIYASQCPEVSFEDEEQ